jgi:hypothetical protein
MTAAGDSIFGIAAGRKHPRSSVFFLKKKTPFTTLEKSACIPKMLWRESVVACIRAEAFRTRQPLDEPKHIEAENLLDSIERQKTSSTR